MTKFNPLNAELNHICHLLALLGAHPVFLVSRIRVKEFDTREASPNNVHTSEEHS
jgi:hypothetical protein